MLSSSVRTVQEHSFAAMGSRTHIFVHDGPPGLPIVGEKMIAKLEARWSRFIPTSDISRLNRERVARVSPDTIGLVERMVEAWRATGGRFDPTVGRAMTGIGYDRDFASGLDDTGRLIGHPADGCEGIVIDREAMQLSLPGDLILDPGGMGKGLAADLVAARLRTEAGGVLVNVGGDVKVAGEGPHDGQWVVEIAEPAVRSGPIATVVLPGDAAIATSTPLRRAWRRGETQAHHLVDPATGLPHERPARLVSAVAADAWWAEAVTKQLIGIGPLEARRVTHNAAALIVDPDGVTHLVGGMEEYLA